MRTRVWRYSADETDCPWMVTPAGQSWEDAPAFQSWEAALAFATAYANGRIERAFGYQEPPGTRGGS